VARRKYRFRALNAGPSRCYDCFLSNRQAMVQVTRDGNLLPRPLTVDHFRLAVGDRVDVVVDFSRLPSGTRLYLVNCCEQPDGRGPSERLRSPAQGQKLIQFVVDGALDTHGDPSRVPDQFFELPPVDPGDVATERTFVFDRSNGGWSVNGKPFDPDVIAARPRRGTAEIWNFVNNSNRWAYSVHVPLEAHQVLAWNGQAPAADDAAREDAVWLGPGESVKTFRRFRDFLGRFVTHGRDLVHSDHALMFQWQVEP